jgi:hypothetical protein
MPSRPVHVTASLGTLLPTLLTPADDPLIRSMIWAGLSPSDLPDATIELSFPMATQKVAAIDPNVGNYPVGSQGFQNCHDAAVLFSAAWLLPIVPMVARETFQGYSYGAAAADS